MENLWLKEFSPADLSMWDVWRAEVDFSTYQTYLLPEEFDVSLDYVIYLIMWNTFPIGAIWLEKINNIDRSGWLGIFIGNPIYWGKGYGEKAINQFAKEVKERYGIEKIFLKVRDGNQRAIRCYEKVGFLTLQKLGPMQFGDGTIRYWYEMRKDL